MRSRAFQKRIQIWQSVSVSDGYGGNTTTDVQITDSWANVTTLNNSKGKTYLSNDLGVQERSNTIVIKLRKRNDITYNDVNQYIVYRGYKYIIIAQPTNINFNDAYIEIIATREAEESVTNSNPIGVYYTYVSRCVLANGTEVNNTCLKSYIDSII